MLFFRKLYNIFLRLSTIYFLLLLRMPEGVLGPLGIPQDLLHLHFILCLQQVRPHKHVVFVWRQEGGEQWAAWHLPGTRCKRSLSLVRMSGGRSESLGTVWGSQGSDDTPPQFTWSYFDRQAFYLKLLIFLDKNLDVPEKGRLTLTKCHWTR